LVVEFEQGPAAGSSYAAIVAGMPTLWITAALLPS
jgi:hypothetical protein